jgi:hypothetical protein
MSVVHETRVEVKMSFYVNVGTESHPEDIDKATMDEIVEANSLDYLKELPDLHNIIDGYEFDDIKQIKE